MRTEKPDFLFLLRVLVEHDVDFIVVGGVCGVLHGAPISTFDLDIVHSRKPENIDKLLSALKKLNAHFRAQGPRKLKPDRSHIESMGHQLLTTVGGPLDLLGTIGKRKGYEDLLPKTTTHRLGGELSVRLLNLEALIEVKKEAAREKDKAVLTILENTLKEKAR